MALVGVQELPGGRVLFGPGALARVPEESSRLGVTAVMLVAAAHCATTLAARAAGPLDALFAEHGLRALAASLPACVDRPGDLAARQEALRGAWLAGLALAGAGTGLHHRVCHVLGGGFGLPHAEVHAAVLPHAVALGADPAGLDRVASALGADDAPGGLWDLARRTGATRSLRQLGLGRDDLDAATEQVAAANPSHPQTAIARCCAWPTKGAARR
jgi:maleylacetate reductase